MKELTAKGKLKQFGLSEVSPTTLRKVHAVPRASALQPVYPVLLRAMEYEICLSVKNWKPVSLPSDRRRAASIAREPRQAEAGGRDAGRQLCQGFGGWQEQRRHSSGLGQGRGRSGAPGGRHCGCRYAGSGGNGGAPDGGAPGGGAPGGRVAASCQKGSARNCWGRLWSGWK